MARVTKDFHRLMKRIKKITDGQAAITEIDWDDGNLQSFCVRLIPNGGVYKGGRFKFEVNVPDSYPDEPPVVWCHTDIYHPNIDTSGPRSDESDTNICLNLFISGEWDRSFGFEVMVLGLLFLMHHPNLEDPLSPYFDGSLDKESFEENVSKYLAGEMVEDYTFETDFVVRDGLLIEKADAINAPSNDTSESARDGNDINVEEKQETLGNSETKDSVVQRDKSEQHCGDKGEETSTDNVSNATKTDALLVEKKVMELEGIEIKGDSGTFFSESEDLDDCFPVVDVQLLDCDGESVLVIKETDDLDDTEAKEVRNHTTCEEEIKTQMNPCEKLVTEVFNAEMQTETTAEDTQGINVTEASGNVDEQSSRSDNTDEVYADGYLQETVKQTSHNDLCCGCGRTENERWLREESVERTVNIKVSAGINDNIDSTDETDKDMGNLEYTHTTIKQLQETTIMEVQTCNLAPVENIADEIDKALHDVGQEQEIRQSDKDQAFCGLWTIFKWFAHQTARFLHRKMYREVVF